MDADIHVVERFIKENTAHGAATVNVVVGLLFCLSGHRTFRALVGILVFIYVGALACYVGAELTFQTHASNNVQWIVLTVCCMVGAMAGAALCFKELEFASAFLVSASFWVLTVWSSLRSAKIFWHYSLFHTYELLSLALAALIGGFFGLPKISQRAVLVVSTSFVGAWMFLCPGIDHFVSDTFTIRNMILSDTVVCGKECQYFSAGALALGCVGVVVQFCMTYRQETIDDFIDRQAVKRSGGVVRRHDDDDLDGVEETSGLIIKPGLESYGKSRSVRDIVKTLVNHAQQKRYGTNERVDYENLSVSIRDKYGIAGLKNKHGGGRLTVTDG